MPRNDINPIPAGFSSLPDYAKANCLDLVQLACAVWRGDMKAWYWTLMKGKGVDPTDCVAIIVATDDKAPRYIDRQEYYTPDKPDPELQAQENARLLTTAKMAEELGLTRSTVTRWLKMLGMPALRIERSEEEYDEAMVVLRAHCAKTNARRAQRQKNREKKEAYWQKPQGYIGVREAADRLGVTHTAVYYWLEKGWLPTTKEAGRWWVREDCVKPSVARTRALA